MASAPTRDCLKMCGWRSRGLWRAGSALEIARQRSSLCTHRSWTWLRHRQPARGQGPGPAGGIPARGRSSGLGREVMTKQLNSYRTGPDERGRFGIYGGRFVAETLMPDILELEAAYDAAQARPTFQAELRSCSRTMSAARPRCCLAPRLTEQLGGGQDLLQARRAQPHRRAQDQQLHRPGAAGPRMGKKRIIAETGAGQHGVATATVAARFGLQCVIYMGERGHRAAAAERVPHAPARRRGASGDVGARRP